MWTLVFCRASLTTAELTKAEQQRTRLRRTGVYAWAVRDGRHSPKRWAPALDKQCARDRVDIWALVLPYDAPRLQRCLRWHVRAERFLRELVVDGLLASTVTVERGQGYALAVRPPPWVAHCQQESVALRRLKRVGRRLGERLRSGDDILLPALLCRLAQLAAVDAGWPHHRLV